MQIDSRKDGGIDVALTRRDVEILRVVLERALFIDVPPNQVGTALDFATEFLRELGEPSESPLGDTLE